MDPAKTKFIDPRWWYYLKFKSNNKSLYSENDFDSKLEDIYYLLLLIFKEHETLW